ncbi:MULTISPECIES: hypothetical protein [Pseudomonas]|jgi:hypothetical protein|uniref:hypothetical protein n=1 Tax=Pseudomonas TaxID=286 RepID=UPI0010D9CD5E|nr:hypothetical protein [Pseudomonas graminis]TDV54469.1 hypothetical protein EC919_104205 [Pseudomonas graminis]
MNPLNVYILLALCGFASAVAGVYVLQGLGWALIAGGLSLLSIAGFVRKGLIGE